MFMRIDMCIHLLSLHVHRHLHLHVRYGYVYMKHIQSYIAQHDATSRHGITRHHMHSTCTSQYIWHGIAAITCTWYWRTRHGHSHWHYTYNTWHVLCRFQCACTCITGYYKTYTHVRDTYLDTLHDMTSMFTIETTYALSLALHSFTVHDMARHHITLHYMSLHYKTRHIAYLHT